MALNILSECFPNDEPFPAQDSAQYYHYVIEALRLAFAETRWYVSDPGSFDAGLWSTCDHYHVTYAA